MLYIPFSTLVGTYSDWGCKARGWWLRVVGWGVNINFGDVGWGVFCGRKFSGIRIFSEY